MGSDRIIVIQKQKEREEKRKEEREKISTVIHPKVSLH